MEIAKFLRVPNENKTYYNRPVPESKLFFAEILQDEAVLPSEETDIEIEPSEVTKILPRCSENESQIELLNQVYRAGSKRSLLYSPLLTEIKTHTGNTVLHIAASYGNDKIVSLVIERAPKLLFEFNENKESALHIAARGGHVSIIEMLLAAYGEKSNMQDLLNFVVLENVEGNTMFHEAMLCRDKKRIGGDKIFKVCELYKIGDSLSKWCYEIALVNLNHAKQSVLYLAVDSEDKEAVKVIMENCPNNDAKPEGLSPVVAAIMKRNQDIIYKLLPLCIYYVNDDYKHAEG